MLAEPKVRPHTASCFLRWIHRVPLCFIGPVNVNGGVNKRDQERETALLDAPENPKTYKKS